jgi:hypothetical protein
MEDMMKIEAIASMITMENGKKTIFRSLHEESRGAFEDFDVEGTKLPSHEEKLTNQPYKEELRIKMLQENLEPSLLDLEDVTGTGIGEDHSGYLVFRIYVKKKSRSLMKKIKAITGEEPIVIEVTGDIVPKKG